jgi:hypothetical protein
MVSVVEADMACLEKVAVEASTVDSRKEPRNLFRELAEIHVIEQLSTSPSTSTQH